MGGHHRRARSDADRHRRGGDERLQHGDGVGNHGGGAPRYQGAQGNERSFQSGWKGKKLAGDIVSGEVDLSGFPRLKKLTATGAITTARLRGLAVRVGLEFPDDTDLSETASVDWVWSLAMLSRGITLKAIGWLHKAHVASPTE